MDGTVICASREVRPALAGPVVAGGDTTLLVRFAPLLTAIAVLAAGVLAAAAFGAGTAAVASSFLPCASSLCGVAAALVLADGSFTRGPPHEPVQTASRTLRQAGFGPPPATSGRFIPSIRRFSTAPPNFVPNAAPAYTRHCSRPCRKMSLGRSMPMNTILLTRGSSSAQAGPRSLPINWCTPWKMTLRSVPCMCSTPL